MGSPLGVEELGGDWKCGVTQAGFPSEPALEAVLGPESGRNALDSFAAAYQPQHGGQHTRHGEQLSLPWQLYTENHSVSDHSQRSQ